MIAKVSKKYHSGNNPFPKPKQGLSTNFCVNRVFGRLGVHWLGSALEKEDCVSVQFHIN